MVRNALNPINTFEYRLAYTPKQTRRVYFDIQREFTKRVAGWNNSRGELPRPKQSEVFHEVARRLNVWPMAMINRPLVAYLDLYRIWTLRNPYEYATWHLPAYDVPQTHGEHPIQFTHREILDLAYDVVKSRDHNISNIIRCNQHDVDRIKDGDYAHYRHFSWLT